MQLEPGAVFGRYIIDAELGHGGMGRVVLATDQVLERRVALKILLPGLDEREEIVARFFREARLAAQLTHPNTVHIYDLGEAHGHPFIAMEYVDGRPLTAYLGDASVPAERRMSWLVDVARGLGAAHARGLLHRDMKPANVMVSRDGIVKVVDFGLAKRATRPDSDRGAQIGAGATFQTAIGFVIGTPAYMAPEQLEAAEDIDARADQFGWALTAYALMLGHNLRQNDPLLFGPIPLLSDKVPGVSRRAAEIVLRALSNDRDMRFPSMDALLAELEPAVAPTRSFPAPAPGGQPRSGQVPAPPVTQEPTPRMPARFCPACGVAAALPSPGCPQRHGD